MKRTLILSVIAVVLFVASGELLAEGMTSVRGRVLDAHGSPVKDAEVKFTVRYESGGLATIVVRTAFTDGQGKYTIDSIPAGGGSGVACSRCCGCDYQRIHLDPRVVNIVNFRL